MTNKHRFRFFGERLGPDSWVVDPAEVLQMSSVLRLDSGSEIELMNGIGFSCRAIVTEITKKKCDVRVIPCTEHFDEMRSAPTRLGVGALKPKDFLDCLPRLVELGVDDVLVFGQVHVAHRRTEVRNIERANKIIREASKVCKRSYLPRILVHDNIEELLNSESRFNGRRLIGVPGSQDALGGVSQSTSGVLALVGGERGLDNHELQCAVSSGFLPVSMGGNVLRATTALIGLAAFFSFGVI